MLFGIATIEKGLELFSGWLEGSEDLSTDMIMWKLAYDGIIPEGEYLITVWW